MFDLHPLGFELPKYKDRLNAIDYNFKLSMST
jgi:hypothetical protein